MNRINIQNEAGLVIGYVDWQPPNGKGSVIFNWAALDGLAITDLMKYLGRDELDIVDGIITVEDI